MTRQIFQNTPTPTCTALGYYEESQQELCERECGRPGQKSAITRADCDSPECQARLCWKPPLSCGEMGAVCAARRQPAHRDSGVKIRCRTCCKSMPSCGSMGGDYCSQNGTCPSGYQALGGSGDCAACCRRGPSCGALGGNYCSQGGAVPAGYENLGVTWDCNPCLRTAE